MSWRGLLDSLGRIFKKKQSEPDAEKPSEPDVEIISEIGVSQDAFELIVKLQVQPLLTRQFLALL